MKDTTPSDMQAYGQARYWQGFHAGEVAESLRTPNQQAMVGFILGFTCGFALVCVIGMTMLIKILIS